MVCWTVGPGMFGASLKLFISTMPRWPFRKARANALVVSILSERAWIGCGRRQSAACGKPQRIAATRRFPASASHRITGKLLITRSVTSRPSLCWRSRVSGRLNATTWDQLAIAVNLPHMGAILSAGTGAGNRGSESAPAPGARAA
jgi:hypothetical protein